MKTIKVVRRQDIEAVLTHEKRIGIRFDRMPASLFIKQLPKEWLLPVMGHIPHGPYEIRIAMYNPFESSCPVFMDMPEEMFNQLETVTLDTSHMTMQQN